MSAPIYRTIIGRALTNQEVDDNFAGLYNTGVTLTEDVADINTAIDLINNTTIPDAVAGKQDINDRLTSLTELSPAGIVVLTDGEAVVSRSIASATSLITVTNGSGVGGNPTLDLDATVLTTTNTKTLSNKTISGNNNTIVDVSLTSGVIGVLPVSKGGTNASTAGDARVNLGAFAEPTATGIAVKNGAGTSISRSLATAYGIEIINPTGVSGNPTIGLNAEVQALLAQIGPPTSIAASIITGVLPIANGGTNSSTAGGARLNLGALAEPESSGIIVKTSLGNTTARQIQVSGTGLSISNGTGVSGNPTISINANSGNVINTVVLRDGSGNFAAGTITANLIGNVTGNVTGTVTNGVVTSGSYSNPSWITALAGSKVTSIPNSSLQNSSITINGNAVSLGGSLSITIPDASGGLKAWVVFSGNPCTIIAQSGNITSVERLSVGRYRITLNNGVFANGNYCVTTGVSSFNTPSGGSNYDHTVNIEDPTATTCIINTGDPGAQGNNTGHDVSRCHVMMIA